MRAEIWQSQNPVLSLRRIFLRHGLGPRKARARGEVSARSDAASLNVKASAAEREWLLIYGVAVRAFHATPNRFSKTFPFQRHDGLLFDRRSHYSISRFSKVSEAPIWRAFLANCSIRSMKQKVICGTFAVILMSCFIGLATAHDWYPPFCCSGGDCAPIAGERVQPEGAGYIVDGRFHIPKSEVKDSMDGRYHGCFPSKEKLLCFFAPPPGS